MLVKLKAIQDGIIIAGDGRHDSMGHSVKFGAYTILQPALVAQLKDTSWELSPLYEHSAFGRISPKVFQVFRHIGLGCVSIDTFFKYQRVSLVSFVFYDNTPILLILSLIYIFQLILLL